jgi:acyl dehydratase
MVRYDDVAVGDELPALIKAPDREQLVKYAAGSGDFNPLHYDPDFPQARVIGDNIVHGRLKYAALGQLVSDWLGHSGRVVVLSATYRGMDLRAAKFTCRGSVTSKRTEGGRRLVDLELWTESEAGGSVTRTTKGSAVVELK